MPIISSFFGIIVRMYYGDHSPPHFHAEYQGQRATFDFDGNLILGQIRSKNARKLIQEWAVQHKTELMLNWESIEQGLPIERIEPLD